MEYYIRSTWANTVIVDEKKQRPAFRETPTALDNRWITDEHFDFADGIYNQGYVAENQPVSRVASPRSAVCEASLLDRDRSHGAAGRSGARLPRPVPYVTGRHNDGFHQSIRHDHMEGRRLPRHAAECRQCRTVRRERTDQANLSGMDTRRNAEEKPSQVAVFNWKAKGPTARYGS